MKKRLFSTIIFIAYCAILIKVMVFKDIPTFKIGQLMLNFGGTTYDTHPANFVPFTTIVPYVLGSHGWIIAGVNLIGNIAPLVPLGFLLPFVCRNLTWKKSLSVAVAAGLLIETMQTILHVGIFDIDDVILNALGVMIGYFAILIFFKWTREGNYKNILITALIVITVAAAALYVVYPWGRPLINSGVGAGDLCGGTGGIGQIVSVGNNTFTIERKDGRDQIIDLTSQTTIRTSAGNASQSDLTAGEWVTLVGGPNPDGSFAADTVLVCSAAGSETQQGQ